MSYALSGKFAQPSQGFYNIQRYPTCRKLGQASKWWGYIQGLPIERTDLAAFWLLEPNNDDTQEALRCLGGTELLGFMSRDAEVSLVSLPQYWYSV